MNFINTFGVLGKTEVSNITARGRDKPYKDSRFQGKRSVLKTLFKVDTFENAVFV